MNTKQYCPQTIQYMVQYTVSIKLHLMDIVYCAIVTLIVQDTADEPLAHGKISLAHDVHCCLNLLSFLLPYPRVYMLKDMRVYTHI